MKLKTIKFDFIRQLFGSRRNLTVLWVPLIVLAKIIRYTILKVTLVDAGIGHSIIRNIITSSDVNDGDINNTLLLFFDKINILGISTYWGFEIYITIIWNILIYLVLKKCIEKYNGLQSLFLVMSIVMLNIFDFTLSKEPIQIIYFLLIFVVLCNATISYNIKMGVAVAIIIFSVVTFRSYYIFIIYWGAIFAFFYAIYLRKKISLSRIIVTVFCIAMSYAILLLILQKISPTVYEELIRVRLRKSGATTDIRILWDYSGVASLSINYLIIIVRLLFPIELIRFGPKFLLYIVCQLTMTSVYFKSLTQFSHYGDHRRIALYIFSGFIFLSAAFEPDFGSWVRHEATLFPMLVIIGDLIPSTEYIAE